MADETQWPHGKRVLVTGAAGGIGSAMAQAFAAKGASLVLADRDETGLARLAAALPGPSVRLAYDQGDTASMIELVAAAGPIDILMNNAGILEVGPLLDMAPETIERILRINLTGPITLARLMAPGMIARGSGVIVNTASQLAFDAAVTRGIYSAAKAGLVQFTRTAGAEWAPLGVRVVALAPGRTLTPMTAKVLGTPEARATALAGIPGGRFGSAAEMGDLALFLASPAAGYVVGETLIADGGYVLVSGRGAAQ